ncbi:MAG: cytochrome b [Pseudomonadota bacterium]
MAEAQTAAAIDAQPSDYSVGQKVIHWLMSIVIILDLFVAQKFGNPMELADRLESRADHATLGTIITLLFIARLYLRWRRGAPALPATMPAWQQRAAWLGHTLLYVFIGFLLLSGVATAVNATAPIALFGQWDITLGQLQDSNFNTLRPLHEFATNAVIALIVVHVLAALYHYFVSKDHTLQRMLQFWKST